MRGRSLHANYLAYVRGVGCCASRRKRIKQNINIHNGVYEEIMTFFILEGIIAEKNFVALFLFLSYVDAD